MNYVAMGQRIRSRRVELGMTQAELAKKCGITSSFIGNIERGAKTASVETLLKLSDALMISLDIIIRGAYLDGMPDSQRPEIRVLSAMANVLCNHTGEWAFAMKTKDEQA